MTPNPTRRRLLGSALALLPATNAWAQAIDAKPTSSLKLNIIGRRRPGMTLAEHRHHIRQVHGELVLRYIRAEPDNAPRRYVQNAVFDGHYRGTAPGTDPFALNRDFVTQVWVTDMSALERSRKTEFYNVHLKDDEPRFVDQSTVVFLEAFHAAAARAWRRSRGLHGRLGAGSQSVQGGRRATTCAKRCARSAWQHDAGRCDR
jgi:EthD domain